MTRRLTEAQVASFDRDGYLCPLTAMSSGEAAGCRSRLEAFERETGMAACNDLQLKAHCFFDWSYRLSRTPAITEVAQDLLGDDVFVFASRFWIKEPHERKFVSWHQDMTYFDLEPKAMITFWIALTDATRENGAMRMIPGSHRQQHAHRDTFDPDNMLTRGQSVTGIDDRTAVDATLSAGQFSVHHGDLLHDSPPNTTGDRRIGLSLMLMPTSVRSTGARRSLTLLCGVDRYHHWDHDPAPIRDRDPAILAMMQASFSQYVGKADRLQTAGREPAPVTQG
jgi:non-heme Fe2+,alpha-ketoglutarate-dependent halogenase